MAEINDEKSASRMGVGAAFVTLVPPVAIVILMIASVHIAPWTPLRITGGVMAVVGLAILTVARLQLGSSFSVTPQAKRLVTHGLYSRIRHPVYVFGLTALSGLAIYTNKPVFLLLLILIVPLQVVRARAEERVLEQRFGQEYIAYRAATWF